MTITVTLYTSVIFYRDRLMKIVHKNFPDFK